MLIINTGNNLFKCFLLGSRPLSYKVNMTLKVVFYLSVATILMAPTDSQGYGVSVTCNRCSDKTVLSSFNLAPKTYFVGSRNFHFREESTLR